MKARKLSILKAVKIKAEPCSAQVTSASDAEPGAVGRSSCYADGPEMESNHVLYRQRPKSREGRGTGSRVRIATVLYGKEGHTKGDG